MAAAAVFSLSGPAESNEEVVAAVRAAAWAARDLDLLAPAELERILGRTVDRMTREDVRALARAADELSRILLRESARRA